MVVQVAGPTEQPAEVREKFERSKDSLIMMVDDEPIIMGVIQAFLEERGYSRFLACEDSTQAMEMIREQKPDVLLLDLVMPEKTGFDILYYLSLQGDQNPMPVIVLTSSSDSESKLRALELGATDFLAKPVDPSELALRLRNSLTVKAYQDKLEKFDQLTGLPNRSQFQDKARWGFRQYQQNQTEMIMVQLGVDRFGMLNNTFGTRVGDELLVQVAKRISDTIEDLRLNDAMVARLGGDEFAVVCEMPTIPLEESVRFLQDVIQTPMYVGEKEMVVTACAGISIASQVRSQDEFIQKAGAALKYAKSQGVGKVQVYSSIIDAEVNESLALESELRDAIANDELELFYQPKVRASDLSIHGFEALIRWRKGDGSMVSPGKFIPIAESSGLIVEIGHWILLEACRQTKELELQGIFTKVSVNVSAHQLIEPDIVESIRHALTSSQLDPKQLVVEITESVMMGDVERSLEILHEIRDLGCSLSIDDFGTGYSSLSYLKRFPIEELKIDQSFLEGIPNEPEDIAIVRAIIALAKNLNLTVTAEGVEQADQVDHLIAAQCDLLQGYHFSRPLPFSEVPGYCQNHAAG